jgi:uncharacterized repeat protein (TIGR01451 family)
MYPARKNNSNKSLAIGESQGESMKIRLLILTATLCLGAASEALGAVNDWTAIGPSGGYINKIVFNRSTPSTVYAIAAGGFYRSQDGGVSWQAIKSDFFNAPQDLAIDPSDATRIYVVTPNYPSLYVSTDGGASLVAVTTLPTAVTNAWQIGVSQNGAILYLTAGKRVFYSSDRAQTWSERAPVGNYSDGRVLKLTIDPTDANTLYASATTSATDAGVFVTHTGATTWQMVANGSESASLPTDFAVNAANSNQVWSTRYDGVWFSGDKGATWTNMLATAAQTIAIDPSNPAILYSGTPFGQIFRTQDAGVNWVDVTGNNTTGPTITIAVNPSQPLKLLAGGYGGLSGTVTSGNQWTVQTTGINSTSVSGLSADPGADRIYMNVRSGGVYYSAGGAASTVPVNNVGSGGLLQLSSLPTLSVTAVLAQPGRLSASLSNGLTQSADGGSTWSPVVPVAVMGTTQQVFAFAGWPGDLQTMLAATPLTIYRSTDGGNLWTLAISGLPANAIVGQFAAAASDPTIVYASIYRLGSPGPSTGFGVYKSSDAGFSWVPANSGFATSLAFWIAVDPTNAKVVYTSTDSASLKSIDGGATWNPLNPSSAAASGYPIVHAIDPKHPSILYGSVSAGIARSADGGTSWQILRASTLLPFWTPSSMIADPNRPENILVATDTSGVQQFTVAPDLSLTLAAPPSPVAVGAAASYVYTLSNLGPFDATGARVSVQLPVTAHNISAAASGGTCTVAATVATCVFGIARVGASNAITVSATAPAAGAFQLSASVAADQPDSKPANNTVTTTQSIAYVADLSVTASGTASAQIGDAVSYSVVVANAGPNTATATQIKFQLAAGLTPGIASSTGGTCSNSAGLVTCMLGDLAAAKSATVTINATAATAGTQVSTATVTSAANDLITANNTATGSTAVTAVPPPPAASSSGGGAFSIENLLMLGFILALQALRARRRRI